MKESLSKVFLATFLLVMSLVIGTSGFHLIEGFDLLSAFYMSVITLSTVGFGEINELSDNGRLFASFYILMNLAILAYAISVVTNFLIEGNLQSIFKDYMIDRKINKLKNHVIVCGYGRNGMEACEELLRDGREFVVIEKDKKVRNKIRDNSSIQMLIGDATTDKNLKLAGIKRADVIIITTSSDAANVFITLTAREMKKNIFIISRASEKETESKLYRAGANRVIIPDNLGGMFMAQMVTKPVVIEFLNLMTGYGGQHYHLEQLRYEDLKADYKDKTLKELDIKGKTGGTVIGVKDNLKGLIPSPSPETLIGPNDTIIVLGGEEHLMKLKQVFMY